MPALWYSDDEVKDFHPIVENALNAALATGGYNAIAEVVHHPPLPHSSIVPDFGIRLRGSGRFVFIIEVKRTIRDVNSQRYQEQTRSYVSNAIHYWEPGFYPYFCVTNVETLILFADRPGPTIGCVLKDNPYFKTPFDPATHEAANSIQDLQEAFERIFPLIFNRTAPVWSNNWELILTQFQQDYSSLANLLSPTVSISKELSLFEFFRLLAYSYLKEYYVSIGNPNRNYFRQFPANTANLIQFRDFLAHNFTKTTQLDFRQIFENHPDVRRVFPDNFTNTVLALFRSQIDSLNQNGNQAIADNSSPAFIFNLLTSKVYDRIELREKGKVMSDAELSNLLATLCINSLDDIVLDPGCGDGALLDAAYDRLNNLALTNLTLKSHNDLLSQIHGIELDSFLAQLATFRLLSRNLNDVNTTTGAEINIGDVFTTPRPNAYDVVLMNPPFLSNDRMDLSPDKKGAMIAAIKGELENYFFEHARQPNLYFYFVNFIWHYLKNNGSAGLILMAKFLNNKDGVFVKQFIRDKIEAVISYPRKYFQEFAVTTVVVLLKKGGNSENVAFLRVTDENLLLNPENIKGILQLAASQTTPSYRLTLVPRNTLNPSDNWKDYLRDQKVDVLFGLGFLTEISYHCTFNRGGAENAGASRLIFPQYDAGTHQFYGLLNRNKQLQSRFDFNNHLGANFIKYAVTNNFERRNYIFTLADLERERAFHFPERANRNSPNLLSALYQLDADLVRFYEYGIAEFGIDKWSRIVNFVFNSIVEPKIIIPRADRAKHVIYYNPQAVPVAFSTNFFYSTWLRHPRNDISEEQQYKFITAFLLSCFGQIQFEINANNQEGLRKIERFHLQRIKLINLAALSTAEIQSVVLAFEALNAANVEFSGSEGVATPRRELDERIGEIIYQRNNLGFASSNELVDYFEGFLADLVEDRSS
ncbi:MAG TPA: BpuSI family type II restriction endonuclease [Pedobacter sp.]|jgi:type I restriction-modification system DNA methylase subunit